MTPTATHINLYHVCHRELWLHANGIRMEHTSDVVYEGKLIGETTYRGRAEKNKQIEIDGVKIDYYDAKTKTVHETKKSNRMEEAHVAQVQYYLYVLKKNGIEGATGLIEYPKQRTRTEVHLTTAKEKEIEEWVADIQRIVQQEQCPVVIKKAICRQCSYYEFCYTDET